MEYQKCKFETFVTGDHSFLDMIHIWLVVVRWDQEFLHILRTKTASFTTMNVVITAIIVVRGTLVQKRVTILSLQCTGAREKMHHYLFHM